MSMLVKVKWSDTPCLLDRSTVIVDNEVILIAGSVEGAIERVRQKYKVNVKKMTGSIVKDMYLTEKARLLTEAEWIKLNK